MRSLTATLLAAQRSASAVPYVKVEVLDMLAGVVRPSLLRLYTGSEPDFHHAATMPADGSLIRARLAAGSGNLYIQRVPNPILGSDFSTWTLLDTAGTGCNIALASQGVAVSLFFVDPSDGRTIYRRASSDSGATWGPRETVAAPSVNAVTWLAAAYSGAGVLALLFASDAGAVYVTKYGGSSWSAPASWSNTASMVTGLGCTYQGDWLLAVSGKDSQGDPRVWTCIYGDGGSQAAGTWSALREVAQARGNSSVSFGPCFLLAPDVPRLSCVEKDSGSLAYNRPQLLAALAGTTFAQNRWRDPFPFDQQTVYGVAMAAGSGNLWLSTPWGVWRGSLAQSSMDVSGDVLSLTLLERLAGGHATILLRNDDRRYNALGAGTYAAIRKGSEVRISPGYVTSAGAEVSAGPACWITGWEHVSLGGRSHLILHASDARALLEAWRARRQYSWAQGEASVLDIITFLVGRAGLLVAAPSPSSTLTTHKPAFTISPGETAALAVQRLLAQVPDVLYFRGNEARLKQVLSGDAADYTYGTTHAVLEGRYVEEAPSANRVQVFGNGVSAEGFAWGEVPLLGERLLQLHDLNLDTQAKALDRAQAVLRRLAVEEAVGGQVVAPPNCGQELYDVVEVTDPRTGIPTMRRRVLAVDLEYQRGDRPRYQQRLGLGGV